jgi:ATPase subunit of ABC transporter with duplicated ATPase domains
LARAFARPSNLLVLDEPTNDLDLETLDLLQEQLAEYPGTVLLVSHDRDFLDRVVTSTIAIDQRNRAVRRPPHIRRSPEYRLVSADSGRSRNHDRTARFDP